MDKQIYSMDVYTDNYVPPFSNDLFRLLAICFLLLDCVNIPDTIGLISKTQLGIGTRSLGYGNKFIQPLPTSVFYLNTHTTSRGRDTPREQNLFNEVHNKAAKRQTSSTDNQPFYHTTLV